jgi:hypothetical protein
MKILINGCYGGFGISEVAANLLGLDAYTQDRANPKLIALVELLGAEQVSGSWASLHIVDIPDNYGYRIHEYDGLEWVVLTPLRSEISRLAGDEKALIEYLEGCEAF